MLLLRTRISKWAIALCSFKGRIDQVGSQVTVAPLMRASFQHLEATAHVLLDDVLAFQVLVIFESVVLKFCTFHSTRHQNILIINIEHVGIVSLPSIDVLAAPRCLFGLDLELVAVFARPYHLRPRVSSFQLEGQQLVNVIGRDVASAVDISVVHFGLMLAYLEL